MIQISSLLPGCAITLTTTEDGPYPQYVNEAETKKYLEAIGCNPAQSALVRMAYDRNSYADYRYVSGADRGKTTRDRTTTADGLATNERNITVVLPLGDCIGAVLYDPILHVVMLSHLGRHNLEQFGGIKSVEFMAQTYGCDPATIHAWLSPAAGATNYPLYAFEHRSLHEVATDQLLSAGVEQRRIVCDQADTTTDQRFYSHSEFLKGNRPNDGRFIVTATLNL